MRYGCIERDGGDDADPGVVINPVMIRLGRASVTGLRSCCCAKGVSALGEAGRSGEHIQSDVPRMQVSAVFPVLNDDHRATRPGDD